MDSLLLPILAKQSLSGSTWKEIKEILNKPPPPYQITFHNKEVYDEFRRLLREYFNIEEE